MKKNALPKFSEYFSNPADCTPIGFFDFGQFNHLESRLAANLWDREKDLTAKAKRDNRKVEYRKKLEEIVYDEKLTIAHHLKNDLQQFYGKALDTKHHIEYDQFVPSIDITMMDLSIDVQGQRPTAILVHVETIKNNPRTPSLIHLESASERRPISSGEV
ncbi:hypothetical protein B0O80DRAFT_497688 [Mortierella sp. GBAus27b]|nr:hypothetical protein B0O80DRAFT_497688 [Mortierella sp. GBAus27b]